jgi:hypothetical protein
MAQILPLALVEMEQRLLFQARLQLMAEAEAEAVFLAIGMEPAVDRVAVAQEERTLMAHLVLLTQVVVEEGHLLLPVQHKAEAQAALASSLSNTQ